MPKTVKFAIDDSNPGDQYAKLYSPQVVDIVKDLHLPRYGLGNYLLDNPETPPAKEDEQQIDDLSRAGKRLIGFCRTNLFKRLESSGAAFLQSVERHVLRNYVFLHAIRNGLPLPLGTQDAEMLDSRFTDEDADQAKGALFDPDDDDQEEAVRETGGARTKSRLRESRRRDIRGVRGPLQQALQLAALRPLRQLAGERAPVRLKRPAGHPFRDTARGTPPTTPSSTRSTPS